MSDSRISTADTRFTEALNEMSAYIHDWAIRKGFWEAGVDRNDGEMIALFHSELSEVLEGLRSGNPTSEKIGEHGFSQVEEEFADLFIRVMDTCAARGWRLGEAIVAKMAYNEKRPYKHGRKF